MQKSLIFYKFWCSYTSCTLRDLTKTDKDCYKQISTQLYYGHACAFTEKV